MENSGNGELDGVSGRKLSNGNYEIVVDGHKHVVNGKNINHVVANMVNSNGGRRIALVRKYGEANADTIIERYKAQAAVRAGKLKKMFYQMGGMHNELATCTVPSASVKHRVPHMEVPVTIKSKNGNELSVKPVITQNKYVFNAKNYKMIAGGILSQVTKYSKRLPEKQSIEYVSMGKSTYEKILKIGSALSVCEGDTVQLVTTRVVLPGVNGAVYNGGKYVKKADREENAACIPAQEVETETPAAAVFKPEDTLFVRDEISEMRSKIRDEIEVLKKQVQEAVANDTLDESMCSALNRKINTARNLKMIDV